MPTKTTSLTFMCAIQVNHPLNSQHKHLELLIGCPLIREVDMSYTHVTSYSANTVMKRFVATHPLLEVVKIAGCRALNDGGLHVAAMECPWQCAFERMHLFYELLQGLWRPLPSTHRACVSWTYPPRVFVTLTLRSCRLGVHCSSL